jgi:uncharacterized Zn finger protein
MIHATPLDAAPFYLVTVRGIVTTEMQKRLRAQFAEINQDLADRIIILDDRISITPIG